MYAKIRDMINRTLVRTKVVQTLFAYYKDENKSLLTAQKDMLEAFVHSYSLYFVMLDLINELTRIESEKIDATHRIAIAKHENFVPSLNFLNNKFAQQVFDNRALRSYIYEHQLKWDAAYIQLETIYNEIHEADFFQEYQALEAPTYEDDKRIWRKIFEKIIANNDTFDIALEEIELHMTEKNTFWTSEVNVILSFVLKTIKRFEEENGEDQKLLEMFDSENEVTFAKQLMQYSIENAEEYEQLINNKLVNWDPERIAYMDRIIMQVALAEIMHFPNIAIQVSLNEYIEIAREYSTESSPAFVNGIIDKIVHDLKAENKLLKAITID